MSGTWVYVQVTDEPHTDCLVNIKGYQLPPGVAMLTPGTDMTMHPEQARALAEALIEAADYADQPATPGDGGMR